MKRSLLALTLFISIAAGIFLAAKNIKLFQVNAATSYDYNVDINYSGTINDWPSYDGYWHTPIFTMTTNSGEYKGFCINPKTPAPATGSDIGGAILTGDPKYNLIKLAIYIYTVSNDITDGIMNEWFSSSDRTDDNYARIHALVGYINTGTSITSDYPDADLGTQQAWLDARKNELSDWVNGEESSASINGKKAWLMAQTYKLYGLDPSKTTEQGKQDVAWIENDPESGSIKVQKCDKETGSCTNPQGTASFSGIKFEVYNASGSRIYVPSKNQFYNNNALIASGTTSSNGSVTFSDLPTNILYRVVEAGTNNSYLLTATPQTTTIEADGSTKNLNFSDDVVRGDLKFTKTSDVDGEPMANVVFKIKSTSGAKEEHLVVTDKDGVVDTSASHALHSFHTNGYDDMEEDEIEHLAYGTWFGAANAVDDDRGALPYDTYEITELKCDANKFCYDIGDTKKTVTIKTDGEVVDLGEWSNDCAEFSITTTATDNTDGDKILAYDEDVEIKDVVEYCLKKDMEFTIKGVVMNKNTKEPLLVDGEKVEQTITLTPNSTCGTTEMVYSLNTKDLGGTDLVIFEELYYGDELILSHSDFDNTSQTVSVAPPPPDTGAITKTTNGGILSNNVMIIVFAIGGSLGLYASARAFSRKRFLNKKY